MKDGYRSKSRSLTLIKFITTHLPVPPTIKLNAFFLAGKKSTRISKYLSIWYIEIEIIKIVLHIKKFAKL
ncbi:hypothetical protein RclHR1_01970011 [Rhizophagus clarus]|uniref:Uncharacterized protein n=1 Tax=Rhizophagus clarus TaxID=94130 RepID=A0A2Z6R288_9GLOM|nr:hypothetical protein RclHR1_01970011 [Rhizophagus clarus]